MKNKEEKKSMKRYIALLRGINISGKNKISMPELKKEFEELGFLEVKTYLNSGNVIFLSTMEDPVVLSTKITTMIKSQFDLDVPVYISLQEELEERLSNAPDWWGDDTKEIYDNLIFLIPPLSYKEFFDAVGNPKEEYEKVYHDKDVIFWSFRRSEYQKSNWWSKTASVNISGKITIRTANTVRKLVNL